MRLILALAFTLLLQACAHLPQTKQTPPQLTQRDLATSFSLNGRMAVHHHGERSTVNLRWLHTPERDDILLLAPLGITVAHIQHSAEGVLLETSDKQYRSNNVESLMDEVLGWHLPLNEMYAWAMARPYPRTAFDAERNASQQIVRLRQDGWEIRYPRYASEVEGSLPLKLQFLHDDLDVLIVVDEWGQGNHE